MLVVVFLGCQAILGYELEIKGFQIKPLGDNLSSAGLACLSRGSKAPQICRDLKSFELTLITSNRRLVGLENGLQVFLMASTL